MEECLILPLDSTELEPIPVLVYALQIKLTILMAVWNYSGLASSFQHLPKIINDSKFNSSCDPFAVWSFAV